jgi:hypothetical protein
VTILAKIKLEDLIKVLSRDIIRYKSCIEMNLVLNMILNMRIAG